MPIDWPFKSDQKMIWVWHKNVSEIVPKGWSTNHPTYMHFLGKRVKEMYNQL